VVLRQAVPQEFEGIFRTIDDFEQLQIFGRHRARIDEGLEVDDLVPVFASVDDHENLLREFVGLGERQDFEELVHGAEAAGEDDESFGQIGEPELTHKKIVELEVQRRRDVLVRVLLEGKLDVESDALASSFVRAKVGCFHDAGASAGRDDETVAARGNLNGPLGQHVSQFAGVFVVAGHIDAGLCALDVLLELGSRVLGLVLTDRGEVFGGSLLAVKARRAEKDDGVLICSRRKRAKGS